MAVVAGARSMATLEAGRGAILKEWLRVNEKLTVFDVGYDVPLVRA